MFISKLHIVARDGLATSCAAVSLVRGGRTECIVQERLVQQDIDAGTLTIFVAATGTSPDGRAVTSPTVGLEVHVGGVGSLALALSLDTMGSTGTPTGRTPLTGHAIVTNTGSLTVAGLALRESGEGWNSATLTCSVSVLAPGQSATCTSNFTATPYDVNRGLVVISARACGTTVRGIVTCGPEAGAMLSVVSARGPYTPRFIPIARLFLQQRVAGFDDINSNGALEYKDGISYEFRVTNTGNVDVTQVVVKDSLLPDSSVTISCPGSVLRPGQMMTCTSGMYAVSRYQAGLGLIANTALAEGIRPNGTIIKSESAVNVHGLLTILDPPFSAILASTGTDADEMIGVGVVLCLGGLVLLSLQRASFPSRRRRGPRVTACQK